MFKIHCLKLAIWVASSITAKTVQNTFALPKLEHFCFSFYCDTECEQNTE